VENLVFDELKNYEINEDYLDILSQLAPCGKMEVSVEDAKKAHIRQIHRGRKSYTLKREGELVGLASIILDYRIPNYPKCAAHVEDVAIKKSEHGQGYGKVLMENLVKRAREMGAYKVILSCSDYNIKFYKKCGFIHTCATMRYDFDEDYNGTI
jgi:glucosamine-phosphate N-acetyltransferase